MLRARSFLFFVLIWISGCSLLFDGSNHEGSSADAGPSSVDGGVDAGADAGADAEVGFLACENHRDCRDTMVDENYVCVPRGGTVGGQFFCADECTATEDCGPLGMEPGHDEGTECLPTDDYDYANSTHCLDPGFPSCHRSEQQCQVSNCTSNEDCGRLNPGTLCFAGVCQMWACPMGTGDCSDEPSPSACIIGPGGTFRFCSDNCIADADCPGGTMCMGRIPDRRCTR